MDSLLTVNLIGYAAVLAGGLVLGTLFGRSLVSDVSGAFQALETRVGALENSSQTATSSVKTTADSTSAAIKSHAEATEKLAAAVQTHAAAVKTTTPAA